MHAHIFYQNQDVIQLVFLHLAFFILLVVAQALNVFFVLQQHGQAARMIVFFPHFLTTFKMFVSPRCC
jgi:hypothetical protein